MLHMVKVIWKRLCNVKLSKKSQKPHDSNTVLMLEIFFCKSWRNKEKMNIFG